MLEEHATSILQGRGSYPKDRQQFTACIPTYLPTSLCVVIPSIHSFIYIYIYIYINGVPKVSELGSMYCGM